MKEKIFKCAGLILVMVIVFTACKEDTLLLNGQDLDTGNAGVIGTGADVIQTCGGIYAETIPDEAVASLYVHICGGVSEPGVYELPAGSRVNDALTAAGGFDPEADREAVNLVRELEDGEQIRIPFIGEQTVVAQSNIIDVNSASVEKLCEIPGIGESRAKAIIQYREEYGGFEKVEDLMKVPGIKEGIYAKMKPYIECR